MRRSFIGLAVVSALVSTSVMAEAEPFKTSAYGDVQVQALWQTDKDFETEVALANLGVKGVYKYDGLTAKFDLGGQYSDNDNSGDADDFEILKANILLANKYGAIFAGDGVSGSYSNIYQRIDIHESNNNEAYNSAMLYEQPKYSENIFCLISKKYDVGFGKLQAKTAIVTPKDNNGSDDDVLMGRILFFSDSFNATFNALRIDEKYGNADDTYMRYALGADYSIDNLTLAAVAEVTDESFNGAENTYIGAATYRMDKFEFGVSYQHKTFEEKIGVEDIDSVGLAIASVKYHHSKYLTLYTEVAEYGEDMTKAFADTNFAGKFANSEDNVSIGVKVRF
ncbi:porin [Ferrimonas lipolytica]|uniref:Porin n=1 Tax=Ferrimonas lipolytica TaxID=2724191 RepID=A0A6H1UHG1_9GAMM|nr:porin [Ferrimonas lipolytica]QIZ77656.1 porin [Ferrimonas lipolytica]